MSDPPEPVSLWIEKLRESDPAAAEGLWHHFFLRLLEYSRKRLTKVSKRVYDEEDAAQSAFHSVVYGISSGRFPDLHDRNGLWRLLLVITSRKITKRLRFDLQKKRNINRLVTDSIFVSAAGGSVFDAVELALSREPTPEFAAELMDVFEGLNQSMSGENLTEIVQLRLAGFNDNEIANRLSCSRRTVQRRLEIIRRQWSAMEQVHE